MDNNNQIIIYQTDDDQTQIDVRLENETVWLTTQQMAMLFDREESNIRRHVINVFKEGELEKENNVHFLHVNRVKKPPFAADFLFRIKNTQTITTKKQVNV